MSWYSSKKWTGIYNEEDRYGSHSNDILISTNIKDKQRCAAYALVLQDRDFIKVSIFETAHFKSQIHNDSELSEPPNKHPH